MAQPSLDWKTTTISDNVTRLHLVFRVSHLGEGCELDSADMLSNLSVGKQQFGSYKSQQVCLLLIRFIERAYRDNSRQQLGP